MFLALSRIELGLRKLGLVSCLERLATKLGCRASWKNERLFPRPKKEDRRGCRGGGDAQDRGRPHLRRGHLLGQALRGDLPRGEIPRSEETPRLQTEAGRRRQEAAGSGPRRAPCGYAATEARVLAASLRGGG